jgi:hypothetical protein
MVMVYGSNLTCSMAQYGGKSTKLTLGQYKHAWKFISYCYPPLQVAFDNHVLLFVHVV